MSRLNPVFLFLMLPFLILAGCASIPEGPSVMVLPGTGLTFDQFRNDDVICRQFATFQIGGVTPRQTGINSGIATAAVGTAVGAAAGAAIAGGGGAAIGAGSGLVAGSLVGVGTSNSSIIDTQQRYDVAYIQCMYAKGHQVPVSGQFSGSHTQPMVAPSNSLLPPPPPPPGVPPPPPPVSQ